MPHLRFLPTKYTLLLLFSAVLFFSCGENRLNVNVSEVEIAKPQIHRFDKDLFALSASNIAMGLPALQKSYPGYADLFIRNLLCPGGIADSSCTPEIIRFVNDKEMRKAYDDCQAIFSDMTPVENELAVVLKHYKYYWPHGGQPKFLAMMSGFNYAIEMHDSTFSIGLEMYLGGQYKFYDMLHFPLYKRTVMRKEFVVRDLTHAWMSKAFPNKSKSTSLLNEMVHQGKLLYLLDALMPATSDTIKIGFSKMQLDWCVDNEKNMWGHLIKNKLLYSNDIQTITKFTGEGPFTTGFVKESPGRTGIWIGWQIVRRYMDNNPKITLDQLMQEGDPQVILSRSQYKP